MKTVPFHTSSTKEGQTEREIDLNMKLGESLQEDIELFSEEVVKNIFDAQAVIKAQGAVRTRLAAKNEDGSFKYTDEQVAEFFDSWKLTGGNRSTKSKSDKALDLMAGMTAEQVSELLQKFQETQAVDVEEA